MNRNNREEFRSDDAESRPDAGAEPGSNAESEPRARSDAESGSEANERDAESESDQRVEDLYKSDVDRRLWAPAVDLDEEAEVQRKRLGRWIEAVRAAFRRWFSIR